MARWTQEEIASLKELGAHRWHDFHERHPERSYDSWECKRRRLFGGSAGTRKVLTATSVRSALDAVAAELAISTMLAFYKAVDGLLAAQE